MKFRHIAFPLLLALASSACMSHDVPRRQDTDLLKAVRRDDAASFDKALASDALVNTADLQGRTPLMLAAGDGREIFIKQLVDAGASLDVVDSRGQTALHFAASAGTPESVKILLYAGADPCIEDIYGWIPLAEAARLGNLDSAKLLLDADSPIDSVDREGKTPLMHAAYSSRNSEQMCRMLLDAGADPKIYDNEKLDALMWAIKADNQNSALLILNHLPSLKDEREFGLLVMQWAIKNGNVKIVEELIEKGVPLNLDTSDFTRVARALQMKGIAKIFANYGLLAENRTPLMWAAIYGQPRIAAMLIAHGADVKAKDNKGNTALDYAKDHATAKVIKTAGGE